MRYITLTEFLCIMVGCWLFAVPRLFTPEIAKFYEDYYTKKGIEFRKGNVLSSFECDESGKVPLLPAITFLLSVHKRRRHHRV